MIVHDDFEQYSDEYWSVRNGIPTASCAKLLVTSTGLASKSMPDYAITLANDLFVGKCVDDWGGNKYTERGTELEPLARAEYELMYQTEVKEVGFITNDDMTAGVSPDGMINDDGLLEIKCLTAKNHTKAILYHAKHKKAPPEYIPQVQMQKRIACRKWCDLMFFHPDLPMLIIRCTPNQDVVTMLDKQLKEVIKERDKVIKVLRGIK